MLKEEQGCQCGCLRCRVYRRSPNRFDHLYVPTACLVNKCSNNRFPWLFKILISVLWKCHMVFVNDESSFQQTGTQSSNPHICLGSLIYVPSPKSDSGKSTSILSQHQVQDGPLRMIIRSFARGVHVSSSLLRGGRDWKTETGLCQADPTQHLCNSYGPHMSSLKFQAHVSLSAPPLLPPHSSLKKSHGRILIVAFLVERWYYGSGEKTF